MDPVENNINLLIAELNKSNIDKEHALEYLGHVFRLITTNNISLDQRCGASMTVDNFLRKVRGGDFRYPSGMLGNWAKQLEEEKKDIDPYDVNDIGC